MDNSLPNSIYCQSRVRSLKINQLGRSGLRGGGLASLTYQRAGSTFRAHRFPQILHSRQNSNQTGTQLSTHNRKEGFQVGLTLWRSSHRSPPPTQTGSRCSRLGPPGGWWRSRTWGSGGGPHRRRRTMEEHRK